MADSFKEDSFKEGGDSFKEDALPPQTFGAGASQYLRKINPMNLVEGVGNAVRHPIDTAKAYGAANSEIFQKAKEAYNKGDYKEAARHGLNYMINAVPGLGSESEAAGDKLNKGDIAGGLADTAAMGTNLVVGMKAPAIVGGVAKGIQRTGEVAGPVARTMIASPEILPTTSEALTGVFDKRAGGVVYGHRQLGRLADAIKKARAVPETPTVTPTPVSPVPTPSIPMQEAPDVARPFSFDQRPLPGRAATAEVGRVLGKTTSTPATPIPEAPPEMGVSLPEMTNRTNRAQLIAKHMNESGISPQDVDAMTDKHWEMVPKAKEIGGGVPSAKTRAAVKQELIKLALRDSMLGN